MLDISTTESVSPETADLSAQAKGNLPHAIKMLKQFSRKALESHKGFGARLKPLKKDCENSLRAGGDIIIVGCGSAGRAAQTVLFELQKNEKLSFAVGEATASSPKVDAKFSVGKRIRGGIAGGDAAYIRAIENFEDSEKCGIRQIEALGVKATDTVILMSASGSASFLKGIIRHIIYLNKDKSKSKKIKCYFVINNPINAALEKSIFQGIPSEDYAEDIFILSFSEVGQQALAGSTRMQAANFQILGTGVVLADAVKSVNEGVDVFRWDQFCSEHLAAYDAVPFEKLELFISALAEFYQSGKEINLVVDGSLAGIVTSDVTELSPTFRTTPVDHPDSKHPAKKVASYSITVRDSQNSTNAWETMLGRKIQAFSWQDVPQTGLDFIQKYNLGPKNLSDNTVDLDISLSGNSLFLKLNGKQCAIPLRNLPSLKDLQGLSTIQIVKDCLNMASTLAMGRIDRYDSNLMSFVKPSNRKLVTRGIRTAHIMLTQELQSHRDIYPIIQQVSGKSVGIGLNERFLMHISAVFYEKMLRGNTDSIVKDTVHQVASEIRSMSPKAYMQHLSKLQLPVYRQQVEGLKNQNWRSAAKVVGSSLVAIAAAISVGRLFSSSQPPSSPRHSASYAGERAASTPLPRAKL